MATLFRWWLFLSALGWLAWPLASRIWRRAPGQGYAYARILGLVLLCYVYWLLGVLGAIPNSSPALWGVVAALALGGVGLWCLDRRPLFAALRDEWPHLLTVELLFAGLLLLCAAHRAFDPMISHTEQPMDFAFLNSILRSPRMPPRDPWLAGHGISYYYGGYLTVAVLARLTGVPSGAAYNLGVAHTMALAAVAAYGVIYDLLGLRSGLATAQRRGVALLGALAILSLGNLEGVLELLRSLGVGSAGFYRWLSVPGLAEATASGRLLPSDAWWWWRATRVIHDGNYLGRTPTVITEFPAFSFVLGDLHPHFMALPFLMLGVGLALALGQPPGALDRRGLRPALAAAPIIFGWLGFVNSWDLPTIIVLAGSTYALGCWRQGRSLANWLGRVLPVTFWLALGSVFCYAPFYLELQSQAAGIGIVHYAKTPLKHYLLCLGPWLLPNLAEVARRARRISPRAFLLTWSAVALLPWVATLLVGGLGSLLWGLTSLFTVGPWLWLGQSALLAALFLDLWYRLSRRQADLAANLWGLLLIVGLGLTYLTEFFYLRDLFDTRMNTMFKLYYQAWALMGICALLALVRLWQGTRWHRAIASASVALLLLCCAYAPAAAYTKSEGYSGQATLDGTAFLQQESPDEYQAYRWLQAQAQPSDVVVEAPGREYYAWTSRLSAWTGVPTVLGWPGHETQWRGDDTMVKERLNDLDRVYRDRDIEALRRMRAYGATYLYVGPYERERYALAPDPFPLEVAYASGDVRLYRLAPDR